MSGYKLPNRWEPLRPHDTQRKYLLSSTRFNVVPAGRRSGKTEIAKRRVIKRALLGTDFYPARFFAAAPTRDQAKRIFWDDLKAMVPPEFKRGISESELKITLPLSEIYVVGMDRPERIEGQPWDGGVLDEYANMKAQAWTENVRPALSDRNGWCDFIGVPEGRNHYYDLYDRARTAALEDAGEWAAFHWKSAEILPAEEIEAARRDLDELTFQQEYEASFVSFEGRAYYTFDRDIHAAHSLAYRPDAPLALCFDFNVDPGVAVIAQEQTLPNGEDGTGIIGEVWIPRNSNTPAVCRRLLTDWGGHEGRVFCYGDATGGARGTAQTEGSDWDIIQRALRDGIDGVSGFGGRVDFRVKKANPPERARINAMNTRLQSGDGTVRMMVDPAKAPMTVRDLEGVVLLKGGSGEIDKKHDHSLTHLTDAAGYMVEYEFPVSEKPRIEARRIRV